ncbi:MAG: sigma factor-like helix-turn-helix DNA-binding protein, partial [Thermoguttaceae bacterium]
YYEEMTMKEIGATLDLSESRVSQMHSAIVKKMRTMHKRIRYEL